MRKRMLVLLAGFALATLGLSGISTAFAAQGQIIVAKSGGDFTTIQAAINSITPSAANPYVIKVMPGTYVEEITMKSYMSLEGSGRETTTIQATSSGNRVISITSQGFVKISGFTIKNGIVWNQSSTAVTIADNTVTGDYSQLFNYNTGLTIISKNNITDNPSGGYAILNNNSSAVTIQDNYIANFAGQYGCGVVNTASAPKITGNIITGNGWNGIYNYGTSAPIITDNIISGNGIGINNDENSGSTISGNIIAGNNYVGIRVAAASPTITGNTITGNGAGGSNGIDVYYSSNPKIMHNIITGNGGSYQYTADIGVGTDCIPNISFNVYDRLSGTTGVGLYNVKSDGTPAPAP